MKKRHDILKDDLKTKHWLALVAMLFLVVGSIFLVYSVRFASPQVTNTRAASPGSDKDYTSNARPTCTSEFELLTKLTTKIAQLDTAMRNCSATNCGDMTNVRNAYNRAVGDMIGVRQWLVSNSCSKNGGEPVQPNAKQDTQRK